MKEKILSYISAFLQVVNILLLGAGLLLIGLAEADTGRSFNSERMMILFFLLLFSAILVTFIAKSEELAQRLLIPASLFSSLFFWASNSKGSSF